VAKYELMQWNTHGGWLPFGKGGLRDKLQDVEVVAKGITKGEKYIVAIGILGADEHPTIVYIDGIKYIRSND